jgi:ABC-type nitrate/sulfonate/bicarbonate transport system permease component
MPQKVLRRLRWEPIAAIATVLLLWTVGSQFTPTFVIPPLTEVAGDLIRIFTDPQLLANVLVTLGRVGLGLGGAFLLGAALGLAMGVWPRFASYALPLLTLTQGIPALSWVVIAIIWFQSVELRIWFIVLIVTLPGFVFQIYDAYRAIPEELREMARSFRPRRFDLFRTVTLPAILPDILTAWKVNLGLGVRVVLVAELVGAAVGVGYQLLKSQQLFDMVGVFAWTAVLVIFVLLVQNGITRLENHLLRYRPQQESDPSAARAKGTAAEA